MGVFLLLAPLLLMTRLSDAISSTDKHGTGRFFFDSSLSQIWEEHFDLIINDYVSDVYVDVLETFIGASIKLFGWAAFGTFLVMKGALLNSRDGESNYNSYNSPQYHHNGRTIVSKTLTESFLGVQNSSGPLNFTLPYIEDYMGLELTFPVDNSLQECYDDRSSCVNNDIAAEVNIITPASHRENIKFCNKVDHLIGRLSEAYNLCSWWYDLAGKLVTVVQSDEDIVDIEE